MDEFTWPVRVYYEDTDAGGVVYYANYLRFMERARTEWLRALGFEQDALREQGYLFAVKNVAIDYRLPAKFNNQLEVTSRISGLGRASITFTQQVLRQQACLADASIVVVCLDAALFRPKALPDQLKKELQRVC
ncbi:MAG TPA: tol-pal system-associated acyl-CoA thioesterase [Gammaproteobacteria bacterium]|nr:tol-pal system-associated acyl-CoA thioesterase [Gammaproteobacteria bacterium]